jgi:N-acetylglutamate synthase
MAVEIRPMAIADYPEMIDLWQNTPGIGLSTADTEEALGRFLAHNEGLNFKASEGGKLVGTVLCGQDGRRGYLYHVAVAQSHRRQGVGKAMVEHSLGGLAQKGIEKCHLFVFGKNEIGIQFWSGTGWTRRGELVIMSRDTKA